MKQPTTTATTTATASNATFGNVHDHCPVLLVNNARFISIISLSILVSFQLSDKCLTGCLNSGLSRLAKYTWHILEFRSTEYSKHLYSNWHIQPNGMEWNRII